MKRLLFLFVLCMMASALSAQQLLVPSQYASIQAAIDAAADGDTVLVAEGTYLENINFLGKPITVASMFALDGDTSHISKTIIDGSQPDDPEKASVVTMNSGEDTTSVLCGFTITGGAGTSINFTAWDLLAGGGVLIMESGGKIINNYIENNVLSNGSLPRYGGGLALVQYGNYHSIVRDNVIRNNELVNHWGFGGGIMIINGSVLCEGNKIMNNKNIGGNNNGGGGLGFGKDGSTGPLKGIIIRNNEIAGNSCTSTSGNFGAWGGGCSSNWGFPEKHFEFYNNLVYDNYTNMQGGGMFCYSTEVNIYNNTIYNNTADGNGNSLVFGPNCKVNLFNNIVWSNSNNGNKEIYFRDNASGAGLDALHNILMEPIAYSSAVEKNNTYMEPLLDEETFYPALSSPAIGRGSSYVKMAGKMYHSPQLDFEGRIRADCGDGMIDIGAYESDYDLALNANTDLISLTNPSLVFNETFQSDRYQYSSSTGSHFEDLNSFRAIPYDGFATVKTDYILDMNDSLVEAKFRVIASDASRSRTYTVSIATDIASNLVLASRLFPNPASSTTYLQFKMNETAHVKISIYNALGQQALLLLDEERPAGDQQISFDVSLLSRGLYLLSIEGDKSYTRKLIVR